MNIKDQQAIVNDFLDKAITEMILDHPSLSPMVTSLTLLDIAVQYMHRRGASLKQILDRAQSAWTFATTPNAKSPVDRYAELIEQVRALPPPTFAEQRAQAIDFVFGNIRLSNPDVTQEMVERMYDAAHNGPLCAKPMLGGVCVCAQHHEGWCPCESDPAKVCDECGLACDHSGQAHVFTPRYR